MGILATIENTHPPAEEKLREAGDEKKLSRIESEEEKSFDPPAEIPCVCLECWTPTFWRAIYGGPLRCAVCDPWSALALVGERWTLHTRCDGSVAWIPCLRSGERSGDVRPPDERLQPLPGWTCEAIDDDAGSWWRFEKWRDH